MEEFKIIKMKKIDGDIFCTFEFKLNEQLFYAHYGFYPSDKEIYIGQWYFLQPELKERVGMFSDDLFKEIEKFILNQKEIRLRNLFVPYKFVYLLKNLK